MVCTGSIVLSMRIPPGRRPALWTTWGGTAQCRPRAVVVPRSTDELREALAGAAERGEGVRVVGSGHSFTGAATTSGTMVDLARLDRRTVRAADGHDHEQVERVLPLGDGRALVTVRAGMRLGALNLALARRGLALENLGDIDRQTVAGALGTGTHGTGVRFTGLAARVRGVRVMTAAGEVLEASPESSPDLFEAARLGLGAVGVVLAVTILAVPAFWLVAREEPCPLDEVLERLDGPGNLVDAHDHMEMYWFPHTRRALTKRNERLGGPAGAGTDLPWDGVPGVRPPSSAAHGVTGQIARRTLDAWASGRRWVDDELLSNGVFWLTNEIATAAPRLTPRINAVASRALAPRTYAAASHEVFVSRRRVRFAEMEYALPRADVVEVLREVDRWITVSGVHVPFPVEVRFTAADDVWLSTAHGRESAYVAVHQYARMPRDRYFEGVEQIFRAAGGRPHWGKLHSLRRDDLVGLYPRLEDFCAVRDTYDPGRLFANAYTTRLFG